MEVEPQAEVENEDEDELAELAELVPEEDAEETDVVKEPGEDALGVLEAVLDAEETSLELEVDEVELDVEEALLNAEDEAPAALEEADEEADGDPELEADEEEALLLLLLEAEEGEEAVVRTAVEVALVDDGAAVELVGLSEALVEGAAGGFVSEGLAGSDGLGLPGLPVPLPGFPLPIRGVKRLAAVVGSV